MTRARDRREFIFLVVENRPVLQPNLDVDATGPLDIDQVRKAFAGLGDSYNEESRQCVLAEAERRAQQAGDPETSDPASVELLPGENWNQLDPFMKRIILAQAITTKAVFVCADTLQAE